MLANSLDEFTVIFDLWLLFLHDKLKSAYDEARASTRMSDENVEGMVLMIMSIEDMKYEILTLADMLAEKQGK